MPIKSASVGESCKQEMISLSSVSFEKNRFYRRQTLSKTRFVRLQYTVVSLERHRCAACLGHTKTNHHHHQNHFLIRTIPLSLHSLFHHCHFPPQNTSQELWICRCELIGKQLHFPVVRHHWSFLSLLSPFSVATF